MQSETTKFPLSIESKKLIYRDRNQKIQKVVAHFDKFDKEYFDGDRLTGYGGYDYHPRFWTDTVSYMAEYYNLDNNSRILDVGCAKGFMMYDLSLLVPKAEISGIDVS